MPTIEQILADAKRTLASSGRLSDELKQGAQSEAAVRRASERLTPRGRFDAYSEPILQGLDVASIPATLLPSPIQPAAAAYASMRGIQSAVEKPTAGNVGMAALGALPYAGSIGRSMRGLGAASKAGRAEETLGQVERYMPNVSSEAHMPRAMEIPKPGGVPYARPTEFNPSAASVERFMPNKPASAADEVDQLLAQSGLGGDTGALSVVDEAAGPALNASGDSAASMEALNRMTGMAGRSEQFGVYDRGGSFRKLIGPEAVDYVPRAGETYGVLGPQGFRTLTDQGGKIPLGDVAAAAKRGARPSADYVHPSDTSGGEFGFESLPEIGEGELQRLQSVFKRVGGK